MLAKITRWLGSVIRMAPRLESDAIFVGSDTICNICSKIAIGFAIAFLFSSNSLAQAPDVNSKELNSDMRNEKINVPLEDVCEIRLADGTKKLFRAPLGEEDLWENDDIWEGGEPELI